MARGFFNQVRVAGMLPAPLKMGFRVASSVMPCLLIQGRRGDEVRSFKQNAASGKPNPTGQHGPL
jgi:hypothetical protein